MSLGCLVFVMHLYQNERKNKKNMKIHHAISNCAFHRHRLNSPLLKHNQFLVNTVKLANTVNTAANVLFCSHLLHLIRERNVKG